MAAGDGVEGIPFAAFIPGLAGVFALAEEATEALDVDRDCLKRVELATEAVPVPTARVTGDDVAGNVLDLLARPPFIDEDIDNDAGDPESFRLVAKID